MSDGRTKDWWIGFCLGVADVLSIRKDIPADVKEICCKMRQDYEKWEKEQEAK